MRSLLCLLALTFTAWAELKTDIEFATPGGVSLTLDAFVPEGDGPFPTCILVHGGGFMNGTKALRYFEIPAASRCAGIFAAALTQKGERLADRNLSRIVRPEGQEMRVVADEVGGATIDGAQQEHHIVRIHWVMAEVKKHDGDNLPMTGHEAQEGRDFGCRDSAGEQLLRIFGERIETLQEAEFALLPTIEDFRRGARRV